MPGKQVTELDALPSFTDNSLLPVHNGAGLKKGLLSQLVNYLGTKFSNPNLLINPDFKINQRGATSYEQQGYSVDRWKILNVTVTPNANGGITVKNDKYEDTGTFVQILENATEGDSTLSCYVTSVSGTVTMVADDNSQVILKQGLNVVHTSKSTKNFTIFLNQGTSITLKWVKLEQGSIATPFIAPNHTEELMKCKYFFKRESIISHLLWAGLNWAYVLIPKTEGTRISPTITLNHSTLEYNGANGLSGIKNVTSANTFVTTTEYIAVQLNSDFGFNSYTPVMCGTGPDVIIDAEIY